MTINDIPQGRTLVALSGGADSVALLTLLHAKGYDIEALHVNFHLRGEESNRDEQFVSSLCKRLGIPLHIKHFETREYARNRGISIEMAARELRYDWFEQMRQQLKAENIAVAHHRDDQTETVLLNLIRGTGIRGLAGMHPVSGHIVRPLLNVSRKEIVEYLHGINQDYVTDSTNLERDALRNRIRLDVIPLLEQLNPHASEHIAQAAERVREALPYYLSGAKGEVLHEQLRGMGFTPAQEAQMAQEGQSGAVFESHTHRAVRDRGRIVVEMKTDTEAEREPVIEKRIVEVEDALAFMHKQALTPDFAYIDADLLSQPLNLRHPIVGDRFHPFGMNGTRLVSDFLTDLKLTVLDKKRQWLLTHGGDIVWVVGLRIDNRFRVTKRTKRVMIMHK